MVSGGLFHNLEDPPESNSLSDGEDEGEVEDGFTVSEIESEVFTTSLSDLPGSPKTSTRKHSRHRAGAKNEHAAVVEPEPSEDENLTDEQVHLESHTTRKPKKQHRGFNMRRRHKVAPMSYTPHASPTRATGQSGLAWMDTVNGVQLMSVAPVDIFSAPPQLQQPPPPQYVLPPQTPIPHTSPFQYPYPPPPTFHPAYLLDPMQQYTPRTHPVSNPPHSVMRSRKRKGGESGIDAVDGRDAGEGRRKTRVGRSKSGKEGEASGSRASATDTGGHKQEEGKASGTDTGGHKQEEGEASGSKASRTDTGGHKQEEGEVEQSKDTVPVSAAEKKEETSRPKESSGHDVQELLQQVTYIPLYMNKF